MIERSLTKTELTQWQTQSHVVLTDVLSGSELSAIGGWTEELAARPETPGRWMKYFEDTDSAQRQLCRIEDFVPYHEGFADLIQGDTTLKILNQLMGEPAVLFKEKINFKLPGGAGFTAHQDAPAFASFGQRYHITMMVAVDDSLVVNGCLEISDPVPRHTVLEQDSGGALSAKATASLPWRPLEVPAGAVVFFDSYLPHRSGPNRSARSRRALYVTYNRLADGNRRAEYYAHKRSVFPPECEREAGKEYEGGTYNLANPIR